MTRERLTCEYCCKSFLFQGQPLVFICDTCAHERNMLFMEHTPKVVWESAAILASLWHGPQRLQTLDEKPVRPV